MYLLVRVLKQFALMVIVLITSSVLQVQANSQWHSKYLRDHPLVGKIYAADKQDWITQLQLSEQIATKQMILLGEKHTNIDHHVGQAKIIDAWLSSANSTALVLEMLMYEAVNQAKFTQHDSVELKLQLETLAPAWKWDLYQPLLELITDRQLSIFGGNLSREQLSEFSSGEKCELSRHQSSINVCTLLPEDKQQIVQQLIYDSHCEYLPWQHTKPMMFVQLAKDASFALTMSELDDNHQIALIAGSVHVRKDIGVPVHLRALGVDSFASIAFINVQSDKFAVDEYFADDSISAYYDYVIFTPIDTNQDPCEEFAQQLKNMRHPSK